MIKLTEILQAILTEKKLCPKGKSYYNRRRAAGEKHSAYLSGRAVKVCKGLMQEDDLDEGLEDTSWEYNGKKITLQQLLDVIKNYPVVQAPIEKIKKIIIKKNTAGIESDRISTANVKYPIIIVIDDSGNYRYVLDGNHRANKAIDASLESIPAKLVNIKKLPQEFQDVLGESLRDWFKKDNWVRIDTQGNITGPCGTMKKGNATTRCLPLAKANSLSKEERAATSKKKAASSKQFVPNTKKAKVHRKEGVVNLQSEDSESIDEYDVQSPQDIKEFAQFMREYKQPLSEAEYHGRKVNLGKPMQGDVKKFKVYVKNPKGKVVKVNFGFGGSSAKGKRMTIKKNNPQRRKSFRARHHCDTNPGPKTKARYWSCRAW